MFQVLRWQGPDPSGLHRPAVTLEELNARARERAAARGRRAACFLRQTTNEIVPMFDSSIEDNERVASPAAMVTEGEVTLSRVVDQPGEDDEPGAWREVMVIEEEVLPSTVVDQRTVDEGVALPEAMVSAGVVPQVPKTKGPPVLPWMRSPAVISAHAVQPVSHVPCLDMRLQDALCRAGIEALFPVQMTVWHHLMGSDGTERDLCVCSPTGSGKTLAYALPIVQMLSTRVLRRLRALVVLPTRDLAMQVKAVFDTIAPAVGLSVGLAVGQSSVAAEAEELVKLKTKMVHSFGPFESRDINRASTGSSVDILVATPGRLMDHLRSTKGFTLQHLQYLVVDETDRLLRQAYQDWLPNVLKVVRAPKHGDEDMRVLDRLHSSYHVVTRRRWCLERGIKGRVHPRVMKLVLSATLTRDPAKIAQLDLYCPMYIAPSAAENRYQLPEHLQSFTLVCKSKKKLLYLVALLQQLGTQQTIIFTASVEATHRLFLFLSCFYEGEARRFTEYSSMQLQIDRRKSLLEFMAGTVQVLVASDAMTRGMDVEGVANVINYDVPVYVKTYVHRVGRTARAGHAGCAFTLLLKREVRHFKKELLSKIEDSSCKAYELPSSVIEELLPRYTSAYERFEGLAAMEDQGDAIIGENLTSSNSTLPS